MQPVPETAQVYFIIGVSAIAMLLMAGSIILFVLYYQKRMTEEQLRRQRMEIEHQKKMIEASLESEERERRRVAGDLHDSIGAMLSTIRLSLISHARRYPEETESIAECKKMLDDTIESVRRISRDLMPSTLERFGLVQAVKELCDRFQTTSAIPIVFREIGQTPSLPRTRELMLFRIIQEVLNNGMKHAQASTLQVTFDNKECLIVTVEDDGRGFDHHGPKIEKITEKGLGLFNIDNRARLAGGTVDLQSVPGHGTKVTITVPYEDI